MKHKKDGTFSKLTPAEIQQRVNKCGDFSYIGGYSGSEGYVDVKCNVCGSVFSRSFVSIRHGKPITCKTCMDNRKAQRDAERRAAKEAERVAAIEAKIEAEKARHHTAICRECGQLFDTTRPKAVFCCRDCGNRYWNRTKDNKSRYTKNGKADYSITLQKLYVRDGGVCKGCGKRLSFESDSNANDYPSIDHIKPINKGGLHRWDNVQLMCRYCNSIKCDTWSEPPLSKKRVTPPKGPRGGPQKNSEKEQKGVG